MQHQVVDCLCLFLTSNPHLLSKQVCTGVMLHGYPLVKTLCGGLQVRRAWGQGLLRQPWRRHGCGFLQRLLCNSHCRCWGALAPVLSTGCPAPAHHPALQAFMQQHDFKSIEDFRGASLPYFTTHHELVRAARAGTGGLLPVMLLWMPFMRRFGEHLTALGKRVSSSSRGTSPRTAATRTPISDRRRSAPAPPRPPRCACSARLWMPKRRRGWGWPRMMSGAATVLWRRPLPWCPTTDAVAERSLRWGSHARLLPAKGTHLPTASSQIAGAAVSAALSHQFNLRHMFGQP